MNINNRFIRIGAILAWVSALLLIAMAFIVFPRGMEYPGLPFLTGQLILSQAESSQFLFSLNILFILDGLFLLGWAISWTALSKIILTKDRTLGLLILFFGVVGVILDFSENSLIMGLVQNWKIGKSPGDFDLLIWNATRHLSYWFPYIGAAFILISLFMEKIVGPLTFIIAIPLTLLAIIGLYIPDISIISNLWFLLFFIKLGFVLWKQTVHDPLST